MSVVVIPCWRRPEFLYATLSCLCEAVRAQCYGYLISVDDGYDPRIDDVIAAIMHEHSWFRERTSITYRERAYPGPAFNILSAWREGREMLRATPELDDDRYSWVALIEEDILCRRDIFEFFDEALLGFKAYDDDPRGFHFGVSACRNQMLDRANEAALATFGNSFVYQHASYQSLGVALRPSSIDRMLESVGPRYFEDPIGYCRERFNDRDLPEENASQDGLIHRVVRRDLRLMLYPCVPRAFHAGWYGTNRNGRSLIEDDPGIRHAIDWREAALMIREHMTSEQMNALGDPRFQDIARCDLNMGHSPLKLV